jgi:hypothetical protein
MESTTYKATSIRHLATPVNHMFLRGDLGLATIGKGKAKREVVFLWGPEFTNKKDLNTSVEYVEIREGVFAPIFGWGMINGR